MGEPKTKIMSFRISETDRATLHKLVERYQTQENVKITQAEMLAKLIREAGKAEKV